MMKNILKQAFLTKMFIGLEIKKGENMNPKGYRCANCGNDKRIMIGKYIDGRWMLFENEMLIAWQPLPEVPEVR